MKDAAVAGAGSPGLAAAAQPSAYLGEDSTR
jgi:hypothetical protein